MRRVLPHSVSAYEDRIEKLSTLFVSTLLDLPDERRGDFFRDMAEPVLKIGDVLMQNDFSSQLAFEQMKGESLKKEPLKSKNVIKLCALKPSSETAVELDSSVRCVRNRSASESR